MYLNLYIPSNLNRIKKVKVASLQTMRPSLVKLTALSGISPFATNVCIDYALPVQLHALTDLVELLDRITSGLGHWWHGNLSLLSPYFMIKSQLYFLVRPNPHEAYIMSSFFLNWTLLFLFISLLLSAGIFQGCSAFCLFRLRADSYVQSLLHN